MRLATCSSWRDGPAAAPGKRRRVNRTSVRGTAGPPTTSTAPNEAKLRNQPAIDVDAAKGDGWHPRVERRNASRHAWARGIRRRILALTVAAVVLYGVAPAVLEVLGAYRRLTDVDPAWWIAVVATSAAGIWCMCAVQRLALNGSRWY